MLDVLLLLYIYMIYTIDDIYRRRALYRIMADLEVGWCLIGSLDPEKTKRRDRGTGKGQIRGVKEEEEGYWYGHARGHVQCML